MKHNILTKAISCLLTLAMLIGVMPAAALPAMAEGASGADTYQVVLSDGTGKRMTEDELHAEAETHVNDENDIVTIEGTKLTWGQFKTMLSVKDLQQLMDEGVIGGYDLTDDAHRPYAESLMAALMGESGSGNEETVKIYLTKKSANRYAVDTAKTANYAAYYLNDSAVYYIEDSAVDEDANGSYVEIDADDFSRYKDYSEATMAISGDNGALTVTASRTGSTSLDAKLNYSVYVTTQSDPVSEGTITIPAGQTTATANAAYSSDKPETAYVRFEAAENCVLKRDSNGSEIKGAACLTGNGYKSSYLADGAALSNKLGESAKDLITDFAEYASSNHADPTKSFSAGKTASFYLNTNSTASSLIVKGAKYSTTMAFSIKLKEMFTQLDIPFTPKTFKIRADVNAGQSTPVTFKTLNPGANDAELDSSTISTGDNNIRSYTSNALSLIDKVKISEYAQFRNTDGNNQMYASSVRFFDHDIYIYLYPERIFDAAIPAGSDAAPVYLPGDTVPIMVRSTTDFSSGTAQSVNITYNAGGETKTVNCSNVLGRYGSEEGQYCTILFGWTMPEDCTGGEMTISGYKNGDQAVELVSEGSQDGQAINKVNCNINYSDRTAAFKEADWRTELVNEDGTADANGDLALILPVKDNTFAWWEWIAGEANTAMQAGGEAPYALSSMYAAFGEDEKKHPIYVHQKDGSATITVRGQQVTVDEVVDYLYIPLESGRLSAVHLHYKGYDTSDSSVPDYNTDATGFTDAYLNNRDLFFPVVSGAGNEYAVNEFDPATKTDTKPQDQEYYTLKTPDDIAIGYNTTWNHFFGNDGGTDTITSESAVKVVPPRVQNWIESTPGAEPLTLTYTRALTDTETGRKYSYTNSSKFSWVSSDPEIATITGVEKDGVLTGVIELTGSKLGDVKFTLVCANGKHPAAVASATLHVVDSPDPYLYVPTTSALVTTRENLGASVHFASNITQRNANAAYEAAVNASKTEEEANAAAAAAETEFVINVYAVDAGGSKTGEPVYTARETGKMDSPVRSFYIPENTLTTISPKTGVTYSYIAEVSAVYRGDALSLGAADKSSYTKQADGSYLFDQSASARIRVKPPVAAVDITRPKNPRKDGEESSFVLDSDKPVISWSIGPANAQSRVEIKDDEGNDYEASGNSFTFPEVPDGKLKKAYTVTVYATNDEETDGWTVASSKIYVYNGDALDLLIYSAGYGGGEHTAEKGDSAGRLLDGSGKPLDSAEVNNRRWLNSMLSKDGKTLDLAGHDYDLSELQNDVNLSAAITLNFGDYAWGMISDQIEWKAEKEAEDTGVLYYHQATQYVDVDDLALNSVFPTSEMIAMGKENGKIRVTATHAGTGQQTSVDLDYNKVTDEFYMFQFFPKDVTTVTYFNGKGEEVTVQSDDQGQLALLEPDSIDNTKPMYLRCVTDVTEKDDKGNEIVREDVLFIGMIEPGDVRSGEADAIENERYPVNTHHLSEPGKVSIYLQRPDKTPLEADINVTYRGGAFYGDEEYTYAPRADIFTEANRNQRNLEDENLSNGLHDNKLKTDKDGALTFYFNLDQVTNGGDNIDLSKHFTYVFEIKVPGFLPYVLRVDPYHPTVTSVLRTSDTEWNIAIANKYAWTKDSLYNSPITNAIIVKRGSEVEYAPLSGDSSRIGNNGQYPTAVLEYETLLWNDSYRALMSENAETKQWSVTGKTDLNQYFYDPMTSTKLGNGYTEQYKKQESEVWCFPFSTWPLITTKLTMDPETFGVNSDGSSTGRTWLPQYNRTRSNVYLKNGDSLVKQMNFEYHIFNGTGMLEPLNSKNNMQKLQETIDGLSDDMKSFHIADMVDSNGAQISPLKDIASLADAAMKGTTGFSMEPYFAATLDPTVYYVFLNMKTTPVQQAFSAITDVLDVGVDEYVKPNKDNGISASYGEYAKLFDKMNEPRDEQGKIVGLDSFANRHKSLSFDSGGSLLLRAEFDPVTKSWNMYYVSGTVDSFIQLGYSISFNPIPVVVLGIGTKVGADKLFKAQNKVDSNNIQRYDLIRQLSVGGGIQVSGGIGTPGVGIFDLHLCLTGSVKYTYSNAKLKSTLYRAVDDDTDKVVSQEGKNHKLTGMIGLQIELGIAFTSVSYSFLSKNFDLGSWPTPEYNKLRNVWEGKATVTDSNGNLLSADYTAMSSDDGMVSVQFEKQSLNLRNMLCAVNAQESLFKTYENTDAPSGIVLGDDGSIFFLDDYIASWADNEGVAQGNIVDVKTYPIGSNTVGDFGHQYLDASGSGSNRFAVWSTQTQDVASEVGLGSDVKVTPQDIGAALKSTEITAAYYNGTAWTTKNLTTNSSADVMPKVASDGSNAVVVWQEGESSGKSDNIFDAGKFDVDSRIMMSKFDGADWSEPTTLFSTAAAGELGNMNVALLNDTTAIIAYTLGKDLNNKDVFYTIVDLTNDGVTSYRVTEDDVDDVNVQVRSVGGGEAVLAWYNAQVSETGFTGDIHLLGVRANGTLDDRIPESISVGSEAEVNSDFRIGGNSLNGLTVAWILSDEPAENADVGSGALYGVQLFSDEEKTVVSPVQRLDEITSGDNIAVSGFEMLADGQSVTAVLEEKDYTTNRKETYTMDTGDVMDIPVGDDKIEQKTASFTDELEVSDPVYTEELAAPDSSLKVSYTVRNHGVHKITGLTLNGTKNEVTLYPGESAVLTETVTFGSTVQDHNYTITADSEDGSYSPVSDTIRFNNPRVSVQEVSVREFSLSADAGSRTVDVTLGNAAGDTLPIEGSGKTLTVQLFSDMDGTNAITEPQTVDTSNYKRIDNSSVTVSFDTTVSDVFKSLGQTGATPEIPETGLPVFAVAQVKDGDTMLSSSVNMTTIKPAAKSEGEDGVEVRMENWKQDTDDEAKTNTATVIVSYTNTSLTDAAMPKYTHVKVFDENGLLLAEQFKENNSSISAESMDTNEITIDLPTGKTVGLITAEGQDEITFDEAPATSGYKFKGWYSDKELKEKWERTPIKDERGNTIKDNDGNIQYEPITVDEETGTFTVYASWTKSRGSGGGGGSSSAGDKVNIYHSGSSANGSVSVSKTNPSNGEIVKITVTPDEGYEVDTVSVTDSDGNTIEVTKNADGTYSYVQPAGNVTVTPTFKAVSAEPTTEPQPTENPSDGNADKWFKDVPETTWYYAPIKEAFDNSRMSGMSDDYFEPETDITRGMFAYAIYRREGLPETDAQNKFEDVMSATYYEKAIAWATENGIVSGYDDTHYAPDDQITREQMAAILYRYAQFKNYDVSVGEDTNILDFTDAQDISQYAVPAIRWAVGDKVITGFEDGSMRPRANANRAQMAVILNKTANMF